jgi:hypothetical protein
MQSKQKLSTHETDMLLQAGEMVPTDKHTLLVDKTHHNSTVSYALYEHAHTYTHTHARTPIHTHTHKANTHA